MNSITRLSFIVIALSSATLIAQRRVNTQVNTQVNRSVNNSMYGGGNMAMGSVKYGGAGTTSRPMPSEVRNAYYKSGATPSEVRMNAAKMGPLTPNGPIDYIPKRGDGGGGYAPRPANLPSYNTGSVRRPVVPPTPNQTLIVPKQFNTAIPPTQFR